MQHICHGADRMVLKRSEHFRSQEETESGVLYIYADKKGVLLFCTEKKQKPSRILMKALKEADENFSSLWIPYDNLDEDQEKNAHLADEVSEYIGEIWNYFTLVQNEILEAILTQEPTEEVMEKARGLIRETFTIVDRDMLLLYEHPELPGKMTELVGENYSEEIIEELLMAKEFHDVAKKREPFYYFMNNIGQRSYCINIVVDDYYYARLVVNVDQEKDKLSSGAEQLAEYLASVVVQMIRSGSLQMYRSQDDQLHLVCHNLIAGARTKAVELVEAVKAYGWEASHSYQVFCLEPYNAAGWDTQVENTMPTMTRKLEQMWRQSCAVFAGKKIMWVLNCTLSKDVAGASDLSGQLPVLLRENVFKAGASSEFQNISLLASALKEAEAALETGGKNDPSYWYYRFDDYRLNYMIDAIREKDIEPALLVHPAIPILIEHDKEHDSELSDTLKMLLKKHGNVTQAAEALFIHRTTLFRRMNQIKELTGIDLDKPDLMLELQLSYRLL